MTQMDPEGIVVTEIIQTKKIQILHSYQLHVESTKRSNLRSKCHTTLYVTCTEKLKIFKNLRVLICSKFRTHKRIVITWKIKEMNSNRPNCSR